MDKKKIIFYGLALSLLLFLAIRIFIIRGINLIPEEAYYWQWSRHLSLSYYDMSPMVAYTIALTTFFGRLNSQLFVRLGAPLITLVLSIYVYIVLNKITGKKILPLAWAVLLNAIPILNVGSVLIVYGNLQMLFFSLTVLFLVYFAISGNKNYWYFIGAAAGMALLSKYTAVFLYPIAVLFLVLSRKYRLFLLKKEPYIAFLISLVLFFPVILWNYWNNFASFRHITTLSGHYNGIYSFIGNLLLFLASQFGIFSPFIYLIILVSIFIGFYLALSENNDVYLALSVSSLVPLFYFIYQCIKTTVQPNWPVFLYFPAYILSFLLLGRLYSWIRSPLAKKALIYYVIISFATGFIFSSIIFMEPFHPLVKLNLGKTPVRDVLGWDKLASLVDNELEAHKKENLLIAGRRFQMASELAYYVKGKPQTYSFNYTFRNNEYSVWNNFKDKKGRNFLYVIDTKYGPNINPGLCGNFEKCVLLKKAIIKYRGQVIRTVKIYLLTGFLYKDKYMFNKFSAKEF